MKQDIKLWFKRAKLHVDIVDSPIFNIGNNLVFQMDIFIDKKTKTESFRVYCGADTNTIHIVDADPKAEQVLLRVKEPRRRFIQRVWNRRTRRYDEFEQRTAPFLRTYLLGMDECHLFIAELPRNVSKIKEAYKSLMPSEVTSRRNVKIKRQGEWFFLPLNKDDDTEFNKLIKLQPIEKNKRIGSRFDRGNPHTAQYCIGNFVKGRIRHSEHKTLKLKTWYRFIRNTEGSRSRRFNWID